MLTPWTISFIRLHFCRIHIGGVGDGLGGALELQVAGAVWIWEGLVRCRLFFRLLAFVIGHGSTTSAVDILIRAVSVMPCKYLLGAPPVPIKSLAFLCVAEVSALAIAAGAWS